MFYCFIYWPAVQQNGLDSLNRMWDKQYVNDRVNGTCPGTIPSFKELKEINYCPTVFIDIVCSHKGVPSKFILIDPKRKNINKLIKFKYNHSQPQKILVMSLEWILDQKIPPDQLEYSEINI